LLSTDLAEWAATVTLEQIPGSVRSAASRSILDSVGTAIAARRLGRASAPWQVAHSLGGPAEARPLTGADAISAPAATLATGALVHALDFDDTHPVALVHPTAVSLPAALCVGQQQSASGCEVFVATVVGLEVVCRLGAASPHGFHARGLHATAVAGTLSSALVTARLMGLSVQQMIDALGIAGSASGGLLEFLDTPADTKSLHPGSAGMNGVLAARLSAAGATGPSSVIEGRRGLYAALSARDVDTRSVTRDLGTGWVFPATGIKPYPSCQLMHVALDAVAQALVQTHGTEGVCQVGNVASVEVDVHIDSVPIVCPTRGGGAVPSSEYAAKFDLPWSVAALIADGEISVSTYSTTSVARKEIAELATRVRVIPIDTSGNAADAPGRAVVRFTDGSSAEASVTGSRGSRARPMSDSDVYAKFVSNCGDQPQTAELADRILQLVDEPGLSAVLELAFRHSSFE